MNKHHYDPQNHHRHSTRFPNYDYSAPGTYFVTISARDRLPLFEHPELRDILTVQWYALPQRFRSIRLDEFVVMPNHVHFILFFTFDPGGTPHLGSVVGTYKSLVCYAWLKYLKEMKVEAATGMIWQRNYHDRIICSPLELQRVRQYIRNNPEKEGLPEEWWRTAYWADDLSPER